MAKLLLVDDEQALLNLLSGFLQRQGFEVVCCPNASAARIALAESTFDIAVIDNGLPDAPGIVVAEEVLNRNPETRVLLSSGEPLEASQLPAGAHVHFLQKPYLPRTLAEAVSNLMQL